MIFILIHACLRPRDPSICAPAAPEPFHRVDRRLGTRVGSPRAGTGTGEQVKDSVQTLKPIVVEGKASGYSASVISSATKTATPLRDVPQAVTVISKKQIADQGMQGMADVVRYIPGVTMGQGEGNRDQPTIRGNGTTAAFFVDGIRDDVQYFRDLYNVERVEGLKGANALIFGRGTGGGVHQSGDQVRAVGAGPRADPAGRLLRQPAGRDGRGPGPVRERRVPGERDVRELRPLSPRRERRAVWNQSDGDDRCQRRGPGSPRATSTSRTIAPPTAASRRSPARR